MDAINPLAPIGLAPWAVRAETSRGRLHHEPESATRSPWQRDRDRIIHSSAFPESCSTRRRCSSTTRAISTAPG